MLGAIVAHYNFMIRKINMRREFFRDLVLLLNLPLAQHPARQFRWFLRYSLAHFESRSTAAAVQLTQNQLAMLLAVACKKNKVSIVTILLSHGANPNKYCPNRFGGDEQGVTPLYIAAKYGYLRVARALITNTQLPIDLSRGSLENEQERITPLYRASEQGHTAIVQLLCLHGANTQEHDMTPLHIATTNGHAATVQALIAAGADVNAVDLAGSTPLHEAVMYYGENPRAYRNIIETLLTNGANQHTTDNQGRTPLDVAADYSYRHRIEVLLGYFPAAPHP